MSNFGKRLLIANGLAAPENNDQSLVYGTATPAVASMVPTGKDSAYYDTEMGRLKAEAMGKKGSMVPDAIYNIFSGLLGIGSPIKQNTDAVLARQYALEAAKADAEKDAKDAALKASAPGLAADALDMVNDAEANAPAWDKVTATLAGRRNALADAAAAASDALDLGDSRKRLASLAALKIASAAPRMAVELPMSKRADAVSALNPEGYSVAPTREEAFRSASHLLAPVAGEESAKSALKDITEKYGVRADISQIGKNLEAEGRDLPASAISAKGFGDKSFYKEDSVDPFALIDYRAKKAASGRRDPGVSFTDADVDRRARAIYNDASLASTLPQGQRALPFTNAVMARLDEYENNPDLINDTPKTFNVAKQTSQYRASQNNTKQMQAISTAYKTLHMAANALDELANGRTNVTAINSLLSKFGKGTSDAKTMQSDALLNLLRSEIPMAVFGGDAGAQGDREELEKALGGNASPAEKANLLRNVFAAAERNRMVSILAPGGRFSQEQLQGMMDNDEEFKAALGDLMKVKPKKAGAKIPPAKDPLGLF